MKYLYRIARALYRLLPGRIRRTSALGRLAQRATEKYGGHNDIYSRHYFEAFVDPSATHAAATVSALLVDQFHPRRVIDVGCGSGAFLSALAARGVAGVGLEYSDAALDICRERAVSATKFDLERDTPPADLGVFDVVISTEVAEHLPAATADRYVSLLASLAGVLVFTAATPGQGGTDHVNEQPHDYWVAKFAAREFEHLAAESVRWREALAAAGVEPHYAKNLMLFRRRS